MENKNKDTGIVEYNIELSDGERNWCNTISILGMVALGIILKIENNVWDYLELTSMALSIWLGSYISIQKYNKGYGKKYGIIGKMSFV